MKPLLVVNPSAGGGRAGRLFGELRPIVERALGPCDVAFTARAGEAIDLAREATHDRRAEVVAVGGDGTIHEVANGILDAATDATALGVIGLGTGGDFRRALGLEHRLDRYLDAIRSGRERRIDVGRAAFRDGERGVTRWFVNVLSVGLGGLVDRLITSSPASASPAAKYALASARAIAQSEPVRLHCHVRLAGKTEERALDAWALAIANGTSFGGGMRVAPGASLDDGRFDVVALTARARLGLASLAPSLYTGTHLGREGVASFACDAIAITSDAPAPLDVDGEPLGTLPLRVELARKALRVRA